MEAKQDISNEQNSADGNRAVLRRVLVHLDGWSGHYTIPGIEVGRTAKRFRVKVDRDIPGRCKAGEEILVPIYALSFVD